MGKIIINPTETQTSPKKNKKTKSRCCILIFYSLLPLFILLLVGLSLFFFVFKKQSPNSEDYSNLNVYALLVAGSRGIENYRHQADVARAYHLLIQKGIPRNNIITMAYDDIANNTANPFPGQIKTSPNGQDYYKDLKIDYRGNDVNVGVLSAVLRGQKSEVRFIGTGRVIESTKNDHIFLYYTDHGSGGILGMPSGEFLTKPKLRQLVAQANCRHISIYIEACNAASLLEGFENDAKVFALAASSSSQNSYATNCYKGICYADEFSIAWMLNSEQNNIRRITLDDQYSKVKKNVAQSTVVGFGNKSVRDILVFYFQGYEKQNNLMEQESTNSINESTSEPDLHRKQYTTLQDSLSAESDLLTMPVTDIPMYTAKWMIKLAKTDEQRKQAKSKWDKLILGRKIANDLISKIEMTFNRTSVSVEANVHNNSEEEVQCYNQILDKFSSNCYTLGTNTYFTTIIERLKLFRSSLECKERLSIINKICKDSTNSDMGLDNSFII